jgi:hypothetical protein
MENKKWYESKVILANMIAGLCMILATFLPGVSEFLSVHFAEAGGAWAILNIILRVFKSNVEIK